MENFSTTHRAMVPWVANVATVAVLLTATWWSNSQRPTAAAGEATLSTPAAQPGPATTQSTAAPAQGGNTVNQAAWPLQTTSVPRDGLQAVSYAAGRR